MFFEHMKAWPALSCIALFLASCSNFPADPNGSLQRIQSEGKVKVGLVGSGRDDAMRPEIGALLQAISRKSGAKPEITSGEAEPLLVALESGELDLVIGQFEKKSPWAKRVTIGPPLHTRLLGDTELNLVPVMPNGENAWIALVEQQARSVGPPQP